MLHLSKNLRKLKLVRSMLAVILAVAVLASSLGITTILAADSQTPAVWDGSVATTLSGGGTESDPYIISNGAELAYAITSGGGADKYYKLTADIYLNDITKITWSTGVVEDGYTVKPWFNQSEDFSGTIDGDGYTVYGMYYDENPSGMVSYPDFGSGLIPKVAADASVVVNNLGVDNAYIEVECGASAFVGTSRGDVTISKCYAGANVSLNGGDAGAFIGRAGADKNATITDSYSLATTNGATNHGLVGGVSMTILTVNNSYNANGPIKSFNGTSYSDVVKITESYETVASATGAGDARYTFTDVAVVSSDNMQGADVFTNTAKMPTLNTNNAYTANSGYPTLAVFNKTVSVEIWNGTVATTLSGGGTESDPYKISNGAELAYAITSGGGADKYYKLTADIYLNDITKINWSTGAATDGYEVNSWYSQSYSFQGTIDGDGHTVYGMYRDENPGSMTSWPDYGAGLIPKVATGTSVTINNLGVDNAYIEVECGAAAFVGTSNGSVTISKCFAGENANINGGDATAFVGYVGADRSATITNSYSLAKLNGTSNRGFVGNCFDSHVTITNSYNANGPLVSYNGNRYSCLITVTNSYETVASAEGSGDARYTFTDVAVLTADDMQGADVFTNTAKMPKLNTDSAFTANDGYPTLAFGAVDDGGNDGSGGDSDDDDNNDNDDNNDDQISGCWDGTVATTLSGTGTAKDPYIISNGSELAYAIVSGGASNKHYKITEDIYLNDITKINWTTGAVEEGYTVNKWFNQDHDFAGTINGNSKVIYGLYFNDNTTSKTHYAWGMGLIPEVIDGNSLSVSNLGIDNCFINYECGAAAFVGSVEGDAYVSIDQCYVGENVSISSADAGAFRGYTTGGTTTTSITNCYSLANSVTGTNSYGLAGNVWGSVVIHNSYNANGPILSESERLGASVASCYQTVNGGVTADGEITLTAANMQGTDALDNASKMSKLNADNVFVAQEGYPILYAFTDGYVAGDDDYDTSGYWDGVTKTAPSKGKGTEASPYLISTAEELAYAISSGGNGAYYKLTADIYLNKVDKVNWSTGKAEIGYKVNKWLGYNTSFYGTIDGDGHVIHGLYYNTPVSDSEFKYGAYGMGLIPAAKAGETTVIKKLGIENSLIKFEHGASAFVGFGESKANITVDQCYAAETVTVIGHDAGAFRGCSGSCTTTLFNCYSLANVSAIGPANDKDIYWGLVGTVWGKLNVVSSYNGNGPILGHPERYEVTITDSYQSVKGGADDTGVKTLTAANMKGTDVFSNKAKMTNLNKYGAYVAGKSYPTLSVFSGGKGAEPFNDEGVKGRVWSGKVATKYAGGTGTENDPYLIETPEQLALLITGGSGDGDNYYKLTADIKLNDTSKAGWEKTAKSWYAGMSIFRGTFDGNGHVVSGIYYYNENNEEASTVGLFQRLGSDSVIKRVGVVNSKIVNNNPVGGTFAGAIVGWLEDYEPQNYPDKKAPIISQCFADDTVYIEATDAGGIIGGASTRVIIENCYFTGELTGKNFRGTFVGDHWAVAKYGPVIRNSYSASFDGDQIGGSVGFGQQYIDDGSTVIENVYNDGSAAGCTGLSVLYMRGSQALRYMKGFDFNNIWMTCEDGTPVLRCFKNAKQYSADRDPSEVEISFSTMGGSDCESLYGIPGYTKITKDMLPTPTRKGYIFTGWHHWNEYGTEFNMEVFPNFDITLYASWVAVGFTVDFEDSRDPNYDYNSGIEPYAPGVENYSPDYILHGWGTLHAKADSEIAPMFLLSYENALEVGKEYEMTIWMATDQENAKGAIEFVYSNYADVNDETVGYQKAFDFDGLAVGEWKEYTVTFTANAPYLFIRTPVGVSLFFDDIFVAPTGKDGELGNIIATEPSEIIDTPASNLSTVHIVIICVAAVLVIGAVLTVIIVAVKRKKKTA